jgi:hypothetical protein
MWKTNIKCCGECPYYDNGFCIEWGTRVKPEGLCNYIPGHMISEESEIREREISVQGGCYEKQVIGP